ncbi:brefeldin A-inhibited guanine nucleotide-exchange protein 2-like [Andrographis paniculata]|uniref:brefeldin A-inhibited guanine nucleotide-exchange protein 2-like n=1 Tax=Andrographis paniculata TaxID=175694 RepID=UPI0021E96EE3|nr:brefeldin A-inhibited guanine nucleotide-exchange protein 2-like [Andrographis paniculata]
MASSEANSRLGQVVVPALDQIIRNVSRRKHAKLVSDCKSAIDNLNGTVQSRSPTAATAASSPSKGVSDPEEASLAGVVLGLSLLESEVILNPIIDALSLNQIKVSAHALEAVQRLIAGAFLHGEPSHGGDPGAKLLAKLIDSVCKCHDSGDENVELMVIKALLSGVASVPLRIHGDCLLHVVKTCYDIYLISKNVVSQTIAKGTMAQISAFVFRRMEADSVAISLLPVVAAELMEAPSKPNDDNSVTLFSLGFITKILQDIDVVNNPKGNGRLEVGGQDVDKIPDSEGGSVDKDSSDKRQWEISIYKKALEVNKGMVENGEGEATDDLDVQIGNKLRRDAYVVLRALCKLSMQAPAKDNTVDSQTIKGKIVALELLKVLLDNSGTTFRTNERFLDAIRQYLCLSLLKNIASPLTVIFQLSCSIFTSLVSWFRAGLKAEVGVFFPMIVLKVLENVAQPNFQQKLTVIQSLEKLSADSQIWIDIFFNYDCDVNATNIFERVINGLLKTAQGVSPGGSNTLQPSQDVNMKQEAMKCLNTILKSMGDWMDKQLRISVSASPKNAEAVDNNNDPESFSPVSEIGDEPSEPSDTNTEASDISEVSSIEQRRAYKLELQEGISLFNRKPSRGIEFLQKANKVGATPEEIASFLRNASGLNKMMIGDYLGEREDLPLKVMHAYVDSFDFQGMEFDEAIRNFLQGFRLPGEAQKIDRIMEKFAQRYCKCNPNAFTSADTAYVLAYSVIMLNTDAHNPTVKNKMSAEDFIRNNRGIDDGKDLPEEYMRSLFERISKSEIKMKDDELSIQHKQSMNSNRMLGLDAILNIVIRKRSEDSLETGDELMKLMQEQFNEKAYKSESTYYPAVDVVILKFMIEACWAPMLAAFSVPLDRSDDEVIISLCLEGFRIAIHITAAMAMAMHRDAFITSLAKFTSLHSPVDIKQKNIDAIKVMVAIADEDGNYLQEAWEHVLTCVSRFDHLRVLGEGGQPYATLFSISQNEFDKSKQARKKGSAASAMWRSSYDSIGAGGTTFPEITSTQLNNLFTKLNLLEKVGEMNHIFVQSQNLNSEAIIDFVKALCKVSIDELRSTPNPRVFSITKIVEITNYNMNRIRLVWSKIWHVLSDFFVTLGCSENLSIAIYAMDTLRQISMKFLDREELANYNFQNEFMKPFVIVMRKSSAVEIRELIIRCVSQLVLSRVDNVKSGWKSMFMVFTTAAYDDHKNNVLLAFEIIEKIVRDYFPYITETETTTFTDCVNCLVAFTNSRANKDINLNSIGFLRFCAVKLAEGDLGKRNSENDPPIRKDKVDYLYLWFPLLAGLSELSFDPRTEIRKSALQVLFESLRQYGHHFSLSLWEKVFDSVLYRIFDQALHAVDPYGSNKPPTHAEGEESRDRDASIVETCTSALQLVVDLFIDFYDTVNPLLNKLLEIFVAFIKSTHQTFAGVGIDAMVRLTSKSGELLSLDQWFDVVSSLKLAAGETLPDFSFVLTENSKLSENSNGSAAEFEASGADEMDKLRREYLSAAISYAKSRAAIQMLLVQAIMDIYDAHGDGLAVKNTIVLFEAVHSVAFHSHKINGDISLRQKLQELEGVTQMPDPPLLRLENLSYQICLTMLQTLVSDRNPSPRHSAEVETHLIGLCREVLQFYVEAARAKQLQMPGDPPERRPQPLWAVPLSSGRRKEMAARAPVVVATLQAICGLGDVLLEKNLPAFFPLISSLISCDHGSTEVQLALSDMLIESVGPVLLSRAVSS